MTWEYLIPLDDNTCSDFPVNTLSYWMKKYIEEVAEDTQTPLGLGASVGLAVLATTLQNKIIVEVKPGWIEIVALFIMSIMEPAERKSAVFSHLVKPIYEFEKIENELLKPEVARSQSERKILEGQLRDLETKVTKGKAGHGEALEKAEELANFNEIRYRQILADDASPEKLVGLLVDNNGTMSIMSAEGTIFEIMAGRYTSNGNCNLEIFLKAHAGEPVRIDRMNRKSEHIDRPALTMGFAIQPQVLRNIMSNDEFRGRGINARFLYSVPTSKVGMRNINPDPINQNTKDRYFKNIKKLLSIEQPEEPHIIKLSDEAFQVSLQFARELEPRLKGDLEHICDWAGKLHGAIIRIAGLLHVAENIHEENPWEQNIKGGTLKNAIDIGYYFLEHAKYAFGLVGIDKNMDNARYLLKILSKHKVITCSQRELHQKVRGKLRTVEELEDALDVLLEYGYICRQEPVQDAKTKGRKPSAMIEVNPLWEKPEYKEPTPEPIILNTQENIEREEYTI